MSEIRRQEEPESEQQISDQLEPVLETENQPQLEMPEDFIDPDGESGKWGKPVKGEVEVEGEKVEVSYREKVIELPKHRQEETGIKRIRRRELLPPFPEGLYDTSGKYFDPKWGPKGSERPQASQIWSINRKFENFYDFLTDGEYPSDGTLVHRLEWANWYDPGRPSVKKHKKEGLYFQEIHRSRKFYVSPSRAWGDEMAGKFNTPIFIFGNRNKMLVEYIDSILKEKDKELRETPFMKKHYPNDYNVLEKLKNREEIPTFDYYHEVTTSLFGREEGSEEKPLRWCHAELAIIPTKRSLNVLFFETEDEKK